jgi:RecB family exonuclease
VESTSIFATAGTTRHRFFQRVSEISQTGKTVEEARALALEEAAEVDRETLAIITLDEKMANVAPEVAMAFDAHTGKARELGRGLERDYSSATATEFVGTTDRLGLVSTDTVYIGDWKGRATRRPAAQDEQLLAAALCACRIHGRSKATLEVIRVIDGEPFHSTAEVGAFELDTFEDRITELAARISRDRKAFAAGDLPDATDGDHCTYCPSYRYCPAKMALARATIGQDSIEIAAIVKSGAALITLDNAPRLRQLVSEADKILKTVREALQDFARQTPVPLPNGQVYGVNPDSEIREIVDGKKAAKALEELFGPDAAEAATVEVTFSGIERATKAHLGADLKRGDLKTWNEKAEQLLKERGLLRVIRGGIVRAFTPKGGKAAA